MPCLDSTLRCLPNLKLSWSHRKKRLRNLSVLFLKCMMSSAIRTYYLPLRDNQKQLKETVCFGSHLKNLGQQH